MRRPCRTTVSLWACPRAAGAPAVLRSAGQARPILRRHSLLVWNLPPKQQPYARKAVRPYPNRTQMVRTLARRRLLQGGRELLQAQVLRAGDAALSERNAAHRAHPQLLD